MSSLSTACRILEILLEGQVQRLLVKQKAVRLKATLAHRKRELLVQLQ
jgi:hypothetical protein